MYTLQITVIKGCRKPIRNLNLNKNVSALLKEYSLLIGDIQKSIYHNGG